MKFEIKDPGSAITHFIGMLMAAFAATPLLIRAASNPDKIHLISLSIFIVSMILLYAASTTYHTLNLSERTNRILRKIDHCMIFMLIAGSYTPVCLIVLGGKVGYTLCAIVWGIAIAGIILAIIKKPVTEEDEKEGENLGQELSEAELDDIDIEIM